MTKDDGNSSVSPTVYDEIVSLGDMCASYAIEINDVLDAAVRKEIEVLFEVPVEIQLFLCNDSLDLEKGTPAFGRAPIFLKIPDNVLKLAPQSKRIKVWRSEKGYLPIADDTLLMCEATHARYEKPSWKDFDPAPGEASLLRPYYWQYWGLYVNNGIRPVTLTEEQLYVLKGRFENWHAGPYRKAQRDITYHPKIWGGSLKKGWTTTLITETPNPSVETDLTLEASEAPLPLNPRAPHQSADRSSAVLAQDYKSQKTDDDPNRLQYMNEARALFWDNNPCVAAEGNDYPIDAWIEDWFLSREGTPFSKTEAAEATKLIKPSFAKRAKPRPQQKGSISKIRDLWLDRCRPANRKI